MTDIVIDESNFDKYFRDVKKSKPQRGDVMAVYRATAELTDGNLKQQIIESLCTEDIGAKKSIQLLMKMGQTNRREAVRLIKLICSDLFGGMPKFSVAAKAYKYGFEMFFYTKKEYIPQDSPNWDVVTLKNLEEFLDKSEKNVSSHLQHTSSA